MALTHIELKRCEKALGAFLEKRRPPPPIRDRLDVGYKIDGQSIELFEVRPDWQDWQDWQDKSKRSQSPAAKATYVRTQKVWKAYWMRRDLKWHGYEPFPETKLIEAFLAVVDRDEYGCFFE
jgi:Protein of unknown function (DUF3024)